MPAAGNGLNSLAFGAGRTLELPWHSICGGRSRWNAIRDPGSMRATPASSYEAGAEPWQNDRASRKSSRRRGKAGPPTSGEATPEEPVAEAAVESAAGPAAAPPANVPSASDLGRPLTLKEKLAAARAVGATPPAAAEPAAAAAPAESEEEAAPAEAPEVPPPAKPLGRPMTMAEKLAAARGAAPPRPRRRRARSRPRPRRHRPRRRLRPARCLLSARSPIRRTSPRPPGRPRPGGPRRRPPRRRPRLRRRPSRPPPSRRPCPPGRAANWPPRGPSRAG